MLSITNYKHLFGIIEESGGKWIVKDSNTGIYLFTSPDRNRQGDYFKLLDTGNSNNYNKIARIGIRNPEYVIHYRHLVDKNVFLNPETIEKMNEALNRVHNPATNDVEMMQDLFKRRMSKLMSSIAHIDRKYLTFRILIIGKQLLSIQT